MFERPERTNLEQGPNHSLREFFIHSDSRNETIIYLIQLSIT